jgi:hypothetical protein
VSDDGWPRPPGESYPWGDSIPWPPDADVITEADVDPADRDLFGDDFSDVDFEEAEAEDRCCDNRRYNKWDSTTWCGCQR